MSWRDHLVMLLTFVATAEHCLMVQYLYAAFSLKVESSEPAELQQMIESWRHNLLAVAREEMGHLLTVQNLLLLLGAPAALARDSSFGLKTIIPTRSRWIPSPSIRSPVSSTPKCRASIPTRTSKTTN